MRCIRQSLTKIAIIATLLATCGALGDAGAAPDDNAASVDRVVTIVGDTDLSHNKRVPFQLCQLVCIDNIAAGGNHARASFYGGPSAVTPKTYELRPADPFTYETCAFKAQREVCPHTMWVQNVTNYCQRVYVLWIVSEFESKSGAVTCSK